jgi:hypothetical protein
MNMATQIGDAIETMAMPEVPKITKDSAATKNIMLSKDEPSIHGMSAAN